MLSDLMRAIAPAFSRVDPADLEWIEATADDVLVRCPLGEFWLCPSPPVGFVGERPWVTIRALVELAAVNNDWGDA